MVTAWSALTGSGFPCVVFLISVMAEKIRISLTDLGIFSVFVNRACYQLALRPFLFLSKIGVLRKNVSKLFRTHWFLNMYGLPLTFHFHHKKKKKN